MVTVRSLVLSVFVLLAVVLLLPTLRAYVNQTGELRDLRAQLAEAEADHDALQVELDRWDDRNYVIKEARDHLNFVMPGDQPWRVLDPETVVDDTDPTTGQSLTTGPVRGHEEGAPWYESVWDSVQLADRQMAEPTDPARLTDPAEPTDPAEKSSGGSGEEPEDTVPSDGAPATGDNG